MFFRDENVLLGIPEGMTKSYYWLIRLCAVESGIRGSYKEALYEPYLYPTGGETQVSLPATVSKNTCVALKVESHLHCGALSGTSITSLSKHALLACGWCCCCFERASIYKYPGNDPFWEFIFADRFWKETNNLIARRIWWVLTNCTPDVICPGAWCIRFIAHVTTFCPGESQYRGSLIGGKLLSTKRILQRERQTQDSHSK